MKTFSALLATAGCLLVGGSAVGAASAEAATRALTTPTVTSTLTNPSTTPPPATVTALDASSDLAALTAYRTYVQQLLAGSRQSQQLVGSFVSTSSQTCKGALTRVNSLTRTQVSGPALRAFGQEIGSDLWLAFNAGSAKPLSGLATTLQSLTWSESAATQTVNSFIKAERAVVALAPSNLCGDAFLLADRPTLEPSSTATFLKRYLNARANLNNRLAAFLSLLERYQTPAATRIVATIDRLAGQFSGQSVTAQQTSANTLLSSLGL